MSHRCPRAPENASGRATVDGLALGMSLADVRERMGREEHTSEPMDDPLHTLLTFGPPRASVSDVWEAGTPIVATCARHGVLCVNGGSLQLDGETVLESAPPVETALTLLGDRWEIQADLDYDAIIAYPDLRLRLYLSHGYLAPDVPLEERHVEFFKLGRWPEWD